MDQLITQKIESFFIEYPKQKYKKGKLLILADNNPKSIYFLKKGIVKSYHISKNGQEVTLNMFKPNTFFPMSYALNNTPNRHYFETMTECIIYKAPKEDVLKFIKQEPDILLDLLKRVYIGIEGLCMHIEYLSAGTASEKLIATILILGKRFGKEENGETTIQLKMNEKELGEYAGINRETVSRELRKLKEKKIVFFTRGIITIPDLKRLEKIYQYNH